MTLLLLLLLIVPALQPPEQAALQGIRLEDPHKLQDVESQM